MKLKGYTIISAINMFTSQLLTPFLIIFFYTLSGANFFIAGLLTAIIHGTQLLFKVPFNWIGDKLSRKPLMILGAFGAAFVFYRMSGITHIDELYFLGILLGFCMAMGSVGSAFLAEMTKGESRGAKVGLFGMSMGLAAAAAVYIGANAIDMFGFQLMFYVVAASEIFYALMMFFVSIEKG